MPGIYVYCFLLFLLPGCTTQYSPDDYLPQALHAEPLVVPLKMTDGYQVNKLNGDSIKPIINSSGDTILTGVPLTLNGETVTLPAVTKPIIIKEDAGKPIQIKDNTYPFLNKPETVVAKPDTLKSIKISPQTDSIIVDDAHYILLTRSNLDVDSSSILLYESRPVKTQPMRYKDNAMLDIQYLDIGQGLKYSYINDLCQDKMGNIWMATDYGISKYDGTYVTNYTENEGLIHNRVNVVYADDSGRIWAGTQKGFCYLDGNTFVYFSDNEKIFNNQILGISNDTTGNLWIKSAQGLICYSGSSYKLFTPKNNFGETFFSEMRYDRNGNIWLNTPGGLVKYDGANYTYLNPGAEFLIQIVDQKEDAKGNIWFTSYTHGVTKYDGKVFTKYNQKSGLSENTIKSFMIDSKDRVWVGTRYNGLNLLSDTGYTVFKQEQGLSENKIFCTLEDNRGNIWAGTFGGGINKLNLEGFTEKIALHQLENSRVRPILKDQSGALWLGTEGSGLYRYDGKLLKKKLSNNIRNVEGFRSMLLDKDNTIWFGTNSTGVVYKYKSGAFQFYISLGINSSLLSLFEDKNQNIWMGTSTRGLGIFKENNMTYYNEQTGLSSNRIFVTIQDQKNNIWIGTEGGGLIKYDGTTFTTFSEKQGLFSKSITSIVEDENGNLWLGTLGAGVVKFDEKSFTYYGQKQGLVFDEVWSLRIDGNGQLWAGTDNGLSVLVPPSDSVNQKQTKYSVYSFGLQDGLKATDFNLNSVCIDNSNRIWWGTGKALITRDLNKPFNIQRPGSLHISYMEINDQYFDFRNLPDAVKNKISFDRVDAFENYPLNLSLPYNYNHLTFYFSAQEWNAPHKIRYSYRLTGGDNTWSTPSAETRADFRNLSNGSYQLEVKAINESNQWTESFIYRFSIRPAWWQTWWFNVVMILISMAFVYFITRQIYLARLRKQKAQLEKELAVQRERQRISSEMHDDIGAGLSGVRLLTEMTKDKLKETGATGDIEKIYNSVGEISAKMKEVIWSLNTENDSLNSLISYLQKQARQLMEHYPGKFAMNITGEIHEVKIAGEIRRHIYLSVKEALHNCIQHSGADRVEMNIQCGENLQITITDNGKGFNLKETGNTGNGLKNMHRRMKEIHGELSMKHDEGLTLTFIIPLNSAV